jgi:hypothetical protein
MRTGKVRLADVMELFTQLAHDIPAALWIVDYVYPNAKHQADNIAKVKRWESQMKQVVQLGIAQKEKELKGGKKPRKPAAG